MGIVGDGRGKFWFSIVIILLSAILLVSIFNIFSYLDFPMILPFIIDGEASFSKFLHISVVIFVGGLIGFLGFKELIFERKFSIEILMSIAAFGALYLNLPFEATIVLLLFSISEYLEILIEDRVRRHIESLSKLLPNKARILIDDHEEYVDLNLISIGDVVLVKPGERFPFDGVIIDGQSMVDQSIVTGESNPVLIKSGDSVYAGTLNIDGVIKVQVSRRVNESFISRVINLVMEARSRKAVMERLVDKFSRFYVPIIIFSSVLTVTISPIFFGGSMDSWLYKSLILIVISCPSAFIISVPATIFIAIIVASKRGILVKGGIYLETMYRVKAILFDKTGTLTLGFPKIHNIKTLNKVDDEILMYVAALERFSNHPIAKAIVKEASRRNLPFEGLRVEGVKEFPGEGIIGYVNGLEVIVGSLNVMLKYSCNCENSSIIFDNDAHMFICVSINRSINASICFFDDVRKEAKFTIESLINLGVKPMLITGDKFDIAMDVASALGISEVYANLSPEEKLKVIKDVKGKYGFVAMVGDGVNDAPALAASDVGIAMGSGVDVALESADVVLVRNKLNLIQYLVSLSRKTMSIAKQNVFVSIVVKMLLGLFGFLGLIPLWFIVAIGDDGLTLLVLLNSLRLTKLRCD
ncbi:MAG: cation-translocating P-type ATPase [Candidatus Methanomethylicia archaeon]